jgi:hypothetical protein
MRSDRLSAATILRQKKDIMKNSLLLVLIFSFLMTVAPMSAVGQSITSVNVSAGSPSHGSANITFAYTGSPTTFRFRIAVSPASCTSGTGGYVVGTSDAQYLIRANPESESVVGLSPSTTYQVCPEISTDGTHWYGGVGTTFTTLPFPNPHPALPVAPVSFDTTYPNTSGYVTYKLNTSCLDTGVGAGTAGNTLQQDLNAALTNQVSQGAIISIAAGAVCRGQIYLSQTAADTAVVNATSVNTTNSTITIPQNAFSEGDILVCGQNYSHAGCPAPVLAGQNYAVHVVSNTGGSEVIQLYFPLPQALGGSLVALTSNGGGSFYYYARHNVTWGQNYGQRNLNWIIIRPSTSDSQFVPAGTLIQGPLDSTGHPSAPTNWLPKMYTLTMANTYHGIASDSQLFSLTDQDGNAKSLNGYVRIVGAHFTFDPSMDSSGGKPMPHYRLVGSSMWNSDFIVDRSWFNPPGHPDEGTGLMEFDGTNVGMVDSYSDNFNYYHPARIGMAMTLTSSSQFTIAPGRYSFGSGSVTLPSTVTVNLSGTTTQISGWVYFDAAGVLYVALPPGISGTCSGYSPCRVFTLGNAQTGYYVLDTSPTFPNNAAPGSGLTYMVEPVTSTTGSCASTQSLFPSNWYAQAGDATPFNAAQTVDVATRFTTDSTAVYFCGWQVFIPTADTATSHTFTLWSDSGTALAQQTSATGHGKVFVAATSAVLLSTNTFYRAGYQFTNYDTQWGGAFQNYDPNAGLTGAAHASQYMVSNGNNNYSDNWPKTFNGRPFTALFGILQFNGSSGLTNVYNSDLYSDGQNTEGCQCMVSGSGPGPRVFKDNYTVGSGNVWHFDDGGGYSLSRHDFTLSRNYFYSPLSMMYTSDGSNPVSDGMQYGHRHSLEWKQGNCVSMVGNILDTSWVEDTPFGDLFEASGVNGGFGICGTTNQLIYGSTSDFDMRSNTFMHAGSVNSVFGPTPGSVGVNPRRFNFSNNLIIDINGQAYCAIGSGFCPNASSGAGLLFQTAQIEDFTMTHNTMIGNNAGSRLPFLFLSSVANQEGYKVRDNILWINGTNSGLGGISADTCGYTNGTDSGCWGTGTYCKALDGLAGFNCAFINSTWVNNLMLGSPSQSQIKSLWPNNIVPSNPADLTAVGWVNYTPPSVPGNYGLRSSSPYVSGGANRASDGLSVGVDFNQLQVDQGYVTLVGTSNITTTSAQINFVAPDAQSCPVDYSPTDPNVSDNSLVRVADTGTGRTRNVSITGLSSGQIYYFRVNCAVNQPSGQFKTH